MRFFNVLCVLQLMIVPVFSLDTTEPFELGVSDIETYIGFGGIGLNKGVKSWSSEHVIGAGISDKFATTLALGFDSNEYFGEGGSWFGLGLYYNLLESESIALDILADISFSEGFALGAEFNYSLELLGFQLSLGEALFNDGAEKIGYLTSFEPLVHWNISEESQLLAAVDFAIDHSVEEDGFEIGSAVIGYNKVLSDAFELITEVSYDIPQEDEDGSLGLSIGFVATVM